MASIPVTKTELKQLRRKRVKVESKLAKAKKRLGKVAGSSWGGCAAKEQAQQGVWYYTSILGDLIALIGQSVVQDTPLNSDVVSVGKRVRLEIDGQKDDYVIGIVYGKEDNKLISPLSPLGSNLIGKKEGEVVEFGTPEGKQKARILNIS